MALVFYDFHYITGVKEGRIGYHNGWARVNGVKTAFFVWGIVLDMDAKDGTRDEINVLSI